MTDNITITGTSRGEGDGKAEEGATLPAGRERLHPAGGDSIHHARHPFAVRGVPPAVREVPNGTPLLLRRIQHTAGLHTH